MPVSAMTPVNSVSKIKGVTQLPLDMQNTLAWLPAFRQLTPFPHSFTTLLGECNLLVDQLWPSPLPISVSASSPDALHPPVRTGINLSQMSQLPYNTCSEAHTVHVCKIPHDVAIPTPLFADHSCMFAMDIPPPIAEPLLLAMSHPNIPQPIYISDCLAAPMIAQPLGDW